MVRLPIECEECSRETDIIKEFKQNRVFSRDKPTHWIHRGVQSRLVRLRIDCSSINVCNRHSIFRPELVQPVIVLHPTEAAV